MNIFDIIHMDSGMIPIRMLDAALKKDKNLVHSTTTSFSAPGITLKGDRWTPLHHAVLMKDRTLMVGKLLKAGADVNASSGPKYGYTPFHCAVIVSDLEMAKTLIDHGADPMIKTASGEMMIDRPDFKAYFMNHMNVSEDASIIAYILKNISRTTRAQLSGILKSKSKSNDILFVLLAWFVYYAVLKNPSMAHLEDIIIKKSLKNIKKYEGVLEMIAAYGKYKYDGKNISSTVRAKGFIEDFEGMTDILAENYNNNNANSLKNMDVLQKIRNVAKSARNFSSVAPAISKRTIAKGLTNWTSMSYRNIQNAHREGRSLTGNPAVTNVSIAKYMKNYAPRAPDIIPGMHRPTYIYRGMHGPMATVAIMDRGLSKWKGYLAFSRNESISMKFGKKSPDNAVTNVDKMGHVLFRLKLDDVPRGTPWIWYIEQNTNNAEMRRKRNTAKSGLPEEEVLMPPGRLEFKSQQDRDIARGIQEGIGAAMRGNTQSFIEREGRFMYFENLPSYSNSKVEQIAKAMTISLFNEPNKKNVRIDEEDSRLQRILHMIQLAFLDRGIVDYVIDPVMFNQPIMIDVVYVQDRNAKSAAYSVPYSR
jgi:hypothetical protein